MKNPVLSPFLTLRPTDKNPCRIRVNIEYEPHANSTHKKFFQIGCKLFHFQIFNLNAVLKTKQ